MRRAGVVAERAAQLRDGLMEDIVADDDLRPHALEERSVGNDLRCRFGETNEDVHRLGVDMRAVDIVGEWNDTVFADPESPSAPVD
jgi:hypothetical protein